jgi:hypothetical protein
VVLAPSLPRSIDRVCIIGYPFQLTGANESIVGKPFENDKNPE